MDPDTNHEFSRLAASVKVPIDADLLTVLLDLLRQGVSPEALYSFLKKAQTDSWLGKKMEKKEKSRSRELRNRKSRSEVIIGDRHETNEREEKQV